MLEMIGYIGIFFAFIYRIPQIIKLYTTKKGEDKSKKTFILHNCAYLFLLAYILLKNRIDYLLCSYYIIGILMNLLIVVMKYYYNLQNNLINDTINNTDDTNNC